MSRPRWSTGPSRSSSRSPTSASRATSSASDGLLKESFERLDEIQNSDHDLTGAPSGFRDLDELTAGFQKSNLVVMAARPGMGKTSLALNIATHLAVREQVPVAIFSLEMSREEVTTRLMCTEGRVDSKRLRVGTLSRPTGTS